MFYKLINSLYFYVIYWWSSEKLSTKRVAYATRTRYYVFLKTMNHIIIITFGYCSCVLRPNLINYIVANKKN